MHHKTIKFVECLQDVIKQKTKVWQKRYSGDICGIHIGRKKREGELKRYFCVVFHVEKKLKKIPQEKKVPQYLELNIPNRGKIKVPTDIVETGQAELGNGVFPCTIGSQISQRGKPEFGTLGPIVSKADRIYILSNMHVLGISYLKQGLMNKTVSLSNQVGNIVYHKNGRKYTLGCFERGRISPSMDAAIARIPNPRKINNIISGIGTPSGYKTLRTIDIYGRIYSIQISGCVSGTQSGQVISNNAIKEFDTPIGRRTFYHLLQIEPKISRRGDSGSVVIDEDRNVLGILLGADNSFSYANPIEPVLATFKVNISTESTFS